MFAASKTDSVATGSAPDAQFNYVTMLLHGDGTNGGQNNTFLDSSTNNFTITRNGNTTQGTFSPYGSNWANYFDGTNAYLSIPDNAAFDLGSGDFTIELWFFADGTQFSGCSLASQAINTYFTPWMFYINTGNALEFYSSSNGSSFDVAAGATIGTFVPNTWNHAAICRSGTSIRCFLNGVVGSTTTTSATLVNATTPLYVGMRAPGVDPYYKGYISNFRLVKGTALYTSAFTPSTAPLTAITNTQLLTCQSNRFIDNSTNAFTITVNGNTSVQRFNPFGASTAYSTSVIGGSGYFDGSGDYLGFPNNTAFDFSTGDFTVEAWVYRVGTGSGSQVYEAIIGGNTSGVPYWTLYVNSSNNTVVWYGNDSTLRSTSNTITNNTWNHIAVSRSSGTLKIFINGVQGYSASVSTSYSLGSGGGGIGLDSASTGNKYFYGYINDTRVVKGTALYTSAFTPPTAPLTAVSGTSLLTNLTNGAIFDNAMMNDLETVGNAQISTSVVKFGTGSLYFNGTSDALSILNTPTSTVWGTESWTIEGWIYPTAVSSSYRTIYANGIPVQIFQTSGSVEIYISSTNGYSYIVNGLTGPASSVSVNTWVHFAVVKNGSAYRVYVNGVGGSTVTDATAIAYTSTTNANIGNAPFGSYPFVGYIDDFRITKGYARYTSNFTPPTAAFSNTGPI